MKDIEKFRNNVYTSAIKGGRTKDGNGVMFIKGFKPFTLEPNSPVRLSPLCLGAGSEVFDNYYVQFKKMRKGGEK
ncbi:hypothetical protein AKJ56_02365 [candidate division MSBL1 archaeon SCGC-AAA382N08]|uniref:Uncharacterized protein n=1 Tax=candidate division MSBL1 archaeon SCGC-AAA382N08 TaxID=1698285 RepID=A0A133VMZ8_9EURY|nr:hypothetical protein AKJ56_02365 [candidate division MSBL1 archaeon SCGC-AAA382N08]